MDAVLQILLVLTGSALVKLLSLGRWQAESMKSTAFSVSLGLGFVSVTLAFAEWQSPSPHPYAGRWAWFYEAGYQAFGPNGKAGFFLAAGLVGIGYGLIRWRQRR